MKNTIKTRKIAILAANGYDYKDISQVMQALEAGGAKDNIILRHQGMLNSSSGDELEVDKSFVTTASVLYDAVIQFADQESADKVISDKGVVTAAKGDSKSFNDSFILAIEKHRHWDREKKEMVPA